MSKFKKRLNELLGLKLTVKDDPEKEPVKQLLPEPDSETERQVLLIDLIAERQQKLDQLEFAKQVEIGKLMMQQAALRQAQTNSKQAQATHSVMRDIEAERYGKKNPFGDDNQVKMTQQYIALMGYPPENGLLCDQAGNYYQIKSVTDQITITGKDCKDVIIHNVAEATEVPIYFAKDRIDMAMRYQHQSAWPYPEVPAVFVYVYDEDRVFMLKDGAGSVFKPVNSWQEISTDGILNAVTNFYRNTTEALQKAYNDPEKDDKFDVFLGTVKLRAEIVEEVKTKIAKGEEVVTEFDNENPNVLPDSEATKRRKQAEFMQKILRSRAQSPLQSGTNLTPLIRKTP